MEFTQAEDKNEIERQPSMKTMTKGRKSEREKEHRKRLK